MDSTTDNSDLQREIFGPFWNIGRFLWLVRPAKTPGAPKSNILAIIKLILALIVFLPLLARTIYLGNQMGRVKVGMLPTFVCVREVIGKVLSCTTTEPPVKWADYNEYSPLILFSAIAFFLR